MEGTRGFAVFLVFLVHYTTLIKPWIAGQPLFLAIATSLRQIGNTGVDLFFVLSGYLIYGSLISRPQKFNQFIRRRLLRIYPAFIMVFVVYLILSLLFPAESKIPSPLSRGVLYIAENFFLLPGIFPIDPMITVAWSLSYEMFYYLTIPLVIGLFRLETRSSVSRVAFFATGAMLIIFYCGAYGGHVRLVMFISGILLYEAVNSQRVRTPSSVVGSLALAIGLLAILLPNRGTGIVALKGGILFVTFPVFCMACFGKPAASLPRVFSWTPMRWLGNMSFSYYLLHGLVLKASFAALAILLPSARNNGFGLFWELLPLMFAITLIPTATLFLTVERPLSLVPFRRSMTVGSHDKTWRKGRSLQEESPIEWRRG